MLIKMRDVEPWVKEHLAPLFPLPDLPSHDKTIEDFNLRRQPPKIDTPHCRSTHALVIEETLKTFVDRMGCDRLTNHSVYAPRSTMGWHTNSGFPGIRRYYNWSEKGGAIFRYKDPDTGEIHDSIDPPGWVCREFRIPKDKLFWHTIYSPGLRLAIGLMMECHSDEPIRERYGKF